VDTANSSVAMQIYALIDPRTREIRYIGKSSSARRRLYGHLRDARGGKNLHSCNWVRSLLAAGFTPEVLILEECEGDGVVQERYHISLGRADGLRLCNHTEGGGRVIRVSPL
jgi:hypothetical protein